MYRIEIGCCTYSVLAILDSINVLIWLMVCYSLQMPTKGAVTTLIAAPQGVLRNFYPMEGYCMDHCEAINTDLFKGK